MRPLFQHFLDRVQIQTHDRACLWNLTCSASKCDFFSNAKTHHSIKEDTGHNSLLIRWPIAQGRPWRRPTFWWSTLCSAPYTASKFAAHLGLLSTTPSDTYMWRPLWHIIPQWWWAAGGCGGGARQKSSTASFDFTVLIRRLFCWHHSTNRKIASRTYKDSIITFQILLYCTFFARWSKVLSWTEDCVTTTLLSIRLAVVQHINIDINTNMFIDI